jgi:hypothetical protein
VVTLLTKTLPPWEATGQRDPEIGSFELEKEFKKARAKK